MSPSAICVCIYGLLHVAASHTAFELGHQPDLHHQCASCQVLTGMIVPNARQLSNASYAACYEPERVQCQRLTSMTPMCTLCRSAVDIVKIASETIEGLFNMKLALPVALVRALTEGLDEVLRKWVCLSTDQMSLLSSSDFLSCQAFHHHHNALLCPGHVRVPP